MELADCDTIFEELADFLTLPPPLLIEDPLAHFLASLQMIDREASKSKAYDIERIITEVQQLAGRLRESSVTVEIVKSAQAGDLSRAKALVNEWLTPPTEGTPP
jgi:hypothetical protein